MIFPCWRARLVGRCPDGPGGVPTRRVCAPGLLPYPRSDAGAGEPAGHDAHFGDVPQPSEAGMPTPPAGERAGGIEWEESAVRAGAGVAGAWVARPVGSGPVGSGPVRAGPVGAWPVGAWVTRARRMGIPRRDRNGLRRECDVGARFGRCGESDPSHHGEGDAQDSARGDHRKASPRPFLGCWCAGLVVHAYSFCRAPGPSGLGRTSQRMLIPT